MTTLQQSTYRNQILNSLSPENFAALQPRLEAVDLPLRQTLIEPDQPIEHVYFPERGYSSIVTGTEGNRIELGMVGREGMVGVPVTLGVSRVPFEYFIQGAGHGFRMTTPDLEDVIDQRPALHRFLLRYAHALNIQTSSTAFANANHTLEMRLARWILMCHDRVDGDDIQITHEFLAMMLGVRRPGVTTTIHVLEGHGLIRSVRGVVIVRDRKGLERFADDAYGLPEAEYTRLMGKAF